MQSLLLGEHTQATCDGHQIHAPLVTRYIQFLKMELEPMNGLIQFSQGDKFQIKKKKGKVKQYMEYAKQKSKKSSWFTPKWVVRKKSLSHVG